MGLQAIVFDVDGTLANTERDGHRVAFNQAFVEHGLSWNWDEALYGDLLSVTGGKERIKHYVEKYEVSVATDDLNAFAATLHQAKTAHYLSLLKDKSIPLRTGVEALLAEARAKGVILAIATTTTPENVTALLSSQLGQESLGWFQVIGAGDIVLHKKPAPDIYTYVLDQLGLAASDCIALEDSHNGLLSAQGAGLKTVVTTNSYTEAEDFSGADLVVNNMGSAGKPFVIQAGDAYGHPCINMALLEAIASA